MSDISDRIANARVTRGHYSRFDEDKHPRDEGGEFTTRYEVKDSNGAFKLIDKSTNTRVRFANGSMETFNRQEAVELAADLHAADEAEESSDGSKQFSIRSRVHHPGAGSILQDVLFKSRRAAEIHAKHHGLSPEDIKERDVEAGDLQNGTVN